MNPTRKDPASKAEKTDNGQVAEASPQLIVLSDPIGFVVERIAALGEQVKVKIHDEQWADVSFETESVEKVILGLREIAEGVREGLSSNKSRGAHHHHKTGSGANFVDKLATDARAAASFCVAADGKFYVDAIPMALKSYLVNFVQDLCGVWAVKATITAGICAKIRSSDSYIANI